MQLAKIDLFRRLNTPVIWLLFVLNFHGYEIANIYLERDPNNRIMPFNFPCFMY